MTPEIESKFCPGCGRPNVAVGLDSVLVEKRLSLISDEARDRCLALRDEAREFLKEVGPR